MDSDIHFFMRIFSHIHFSVLNVNIYASIMNIV